MLKPTLINQVEDLARSRNWSCLSHVVNGAGEWTLLQWRCEAGHVWGASLRTAKREGCSTCNKKSKVKPPPQRFLPSLWRDVAPPVQATPQEIMSTPTPPEATRSHWPDRAPKKPKKTKKTKKSSRFSGIIA